MTDNEKSLLISDVNQRLIYNLECKIPVFNQSTAQVEELNGVITKVDIKHQSFEVSVNGAYYSSGVITPYLRSMSDMTSEELSQIKSITGCTDVDITKFSFNQTIAQGLKPVNWSLTYEQIVKLMKLLNSHYLDYNNLIGEGLAIRVNNDYYRF